MSHLRSTGSAKVGIVGFCMGGALSLIAAKACGVDCACAFYGVPDVAKCDPATLAVPVLGHFGALDALEGFSDAKTAKRLADALRESPRAEDSAVHMYDASATRSRTSRPRRTPVSRRGKKRKGFPFTTPTPRASRGRERLRFSRNTSGKSRVPKPSRHGEETFVDA